MTIFQECEQDCLIYGEVLSEVDTEMYASVEKFGEQNHNSPDWLMILAEEVGEANRAALEARFGIGGWTAVENMVKLRAELVQVAAVACNFIRSLDRNELKPLNEVMASLESGPVSLPTQLDN